MATALLIIALVLPIVLFWTLAARPAPGAAKSAGLAVVSGWVLNIAWAATAGESLAIAAGLGWLCPAVLVLITWGVRRLVARRTG